MKYQLTHSNLKRSIDSAKTILGTEFVEGLKSSSTAKNKGLVANAIDNFNRHPFSTWVDSIHHDYEVYESNEKTFLSRNSFLFISLIASLEKLSSLHEFKRITKSLKNKNKFYSASFEARIAVEQMLAGYSIEIIPESDEHGKKTPDFRVTTQNGDVFIECKSLDDIEKDQTALWKEVFYRVAECWVKINRKWDIQLTPTRFIDHKIKDDLTKCISKLIKEDSPSNFSLLNGDIKGEIKCVNNQEDLHDLCNSTGRLGIYLVKGTGINSSQMTITTAFRINVNPFEENFISNRIINTLKKAHKQLINKGHPAIVYIQLPHVDAERIFSIIDNIWRA